MHWAFYLGNIVLNSVINAIPVHRYFALNTYQSINFGLTAGLHKHYVIMVDKYAQQEAMVKNTAWNWFAVSGWRWNRVFLDKNF